MVKDTTLYERLEIPPQSSESEIKKAFMKLSKVWHPDKNSNSEESTKKFQEIYEAKEILLDQTKRELYDRHGMDAFNNDNGNDMQNPFSGFEQFFGGGSSFGGGFNFGHQRQRKENEDIEETLNVELNQLYNEETIDFTYKYKHYCQPCNGEGTKNGLPSKCEACAGKGMRIQIIRMGPMIQQVMSNCNECNGSGKNNSNRDNKCTLCNGVCFNYKDKTIQIPLKSGLVHGNIITMHNKGHIFKNHKSSLKITINELKHNVFIHINNDLFVNININLNQALFGFHKIIKHLDNRELYITSTKITNFNTIRKIQNEGMKNINQKNKGDLYIKFNIILPNKELIEVNPEFKEHFKRLLNILDQEEVKQEETIANTPNLIKYNLIDLSQNITDNILKIMTESQSTQNTRQEQHSRHEQNPNCVQS